MPVIRITFRGTRRLAANVVKSVVRSLVGRGNEYRDLADGVGLAVAVAALSDVKADFVRKSHGEVGEDGVQWEPLAPSTIARRRVGKGDLANPVIKERKKIVDREYRKLINVYRLTMNESAAQSLARQVAETRATRITGSSMEDVLSQREVDANPEARISTSQPLTIKWRNIKIRPLKGSID